jgi:hypothetical protein
MGVILYRDNWNTFTTAFGTYFGTADVINTSWAGIDPTGTYKGTILLDGMVYNNPQTTCVAIAGSGANTVGWPGSGYNSITVGGLGNANAYDSVAGFSSRGPQDYNDPVNGTIAGVRAAVDISAPATGIKTGYFGGQSGGNNPSVAGSPSGSPGNSSSYTLGLYGTSLAGPMVTGRAALLASTSYNTAGLSDNTNSRDGRVIKAVLLNSAEKTSGWDNGQTTWGTGVRTTQSLDYGVGAGQINLDSACDQYLAGTMDVAGQVSGNLGPVEPEGWDFGQVGKGTDNDYYINTRLKEGSTFAATLSWFRDRSSSGSTAYDNGQSNLDLIVFDARTSEQYGLAWSGIPDPLSQPGLEDGTWFYSKGGSWNNSNYWIGGVVPNGNTQTAILGPLITDSSTLFTNQTVTIKKITFDSSETYALAGTGLLELESNSGSAELEVLQGTQNLQIRVELKDYTNVAIAGGAALEFNNRLDLNGYSLVKSGGGTLHINNTVVTGGGSVIGASGSITGSGMVVGDLENIEGTVAPGNSPGTLTVTGDFIQQAGGTLQLEIGGITAGTTHDVLAVGGTLSVAGALEVIFTGGYTPAAGDQFEVLDFSQLEGKFTLDLPELGAGLAWDTAGLYSTGQLSVAIPEPATLLLALLALAAVPRRVPRR